MDAGELLNKFSAIETFEYPFMHLVSENFLKGEDLKLLLSELEDLEKMIPTKIFDSPFGRKREFREFPTEYKFTNQLLGFFGGKEFINELKIKFDVPSELEMFPDPTYDGGGFVISPPGSFLTYHADFNFSSATNMYRSINILFYLNENYDTNQGGELHLLDTESKTVEKSVSPRANTILGFRTDDVSFHGVSKNGKNFFRKSFNLYYYTKFPISGNQSLDPHKTIWVNNVDHQH
jgi:2OG-Fe(II) oxygenase superfamily